MAKRIWALLLMVLFMVTVAAMAEDIMLMDADHVCWAWCSNKTECAECHQPYDGTNIEHGVNSQEIISNEDEHWVQCQCGYRKESVEKHHRFCDEDICAMCKRPYLGNPDHRDLVPKSDASGHWEVCSKCPYVSPVESHAGKNGTCDTCGYQYEDPTPTPEGTKDPDDKEQPTETNDSDATPTPTKTDDSGETPPPTKTDDSGETPPPTKTDDSGETPPPTKTDDSGETPPPTKTDDSGETPPPTKTDDSGETPPPTKTDDPGETPPPTKTDDSGETPPPTKTDDPGETPPPTKTDDPGETPPPTKTDDPGETTQPSEPDVPEETEKPTETEPPAVTEAPAVSEAPEVTEAPAVTEAPEATEAPAVTEAPEVTEAPAVTEAPEATEAPTATGAPEVTEAPAVTEAPGETEAPTEPETPDVTEAPAATETPADTETATATVTPTISEMPGVTGTPTAMPIRTAVPAATVAPVLEGERFLDRFQSHSHMAANGELLLGSVKETITLVMDVTEEPGYHGSALTIYETDSRSDGVAISLSCEYEPEGLLKFQAWQETITGIGALRETESFGSFVELAEALVHALLPEKTGEEVDEIIVALLQSGFDGTLEAANLSEIAFDEDAEGEVVGYLAEEGYEIFLILRDENVSLLVRTIE